MVGDKEIRRAKREHQKAVFLMQYCKACLLFLVVLIMAICIRCALADLPCYAVRADGSAWAVANGVQGVYIQYGSNCVDGVWRPKYQGGENFGWEIVWTNYAGEYSRWVLKGVSGGAVAQYGGVEDGFMMGSASMTFSVDTWNNGNSIEGPGAGGYGIDVLGMGNDWLELAEGQNVRVMFLGYGYDPYIMPVPEGMEGYYWWDNTNEVFTFVQSNFTWDAWTTTNQGETVAQDTNKMTESGLPFTVPETDQGHWMYDTNTGSFIWVLGSGQEQKLPPPPSVTWGEINSGIGDLNTNVVSGNAAIVSGISGLGAIVAGIGLGDVTNSATTNGVEYLGTNMLSGITNIYQQWRESSTGLVRSIVDSGFTNIISVIAFKSNYVASDSFYLCDWPWGTNGITLSWSAIGIDSEKAASLKKLIKVLICVCALLTVVAILKDSGNTEGDK